MVGLRSTGTNHLMAISGLHIGLVAGLAYLLTLRLWSMAAPLCLFLAAPRAAGVASLLAAILYAALADFSIPTQRALIMVGVVMANVMAGRVSPPTYVLGLALMGVLVVDPFSVLSPGFWLSFTAVAVILIAVCGRRAQQTSAWQGVWWRWGRLQFIVAVGLAPLTLVFFHYQSLVSPLANAVAIPWVSMLVVPATLAGVSLVGLWPGAGALLLKFAAGSLDVLWGLLEQLASLDLSVGSSGALPWWMAIGLMLFCAMCLLPPGIPG